MPKALSPSFQFYPADFLADSNVQAMSLDACGAYIRLLCHCWNDESLPTDATKLARLCGASPRQFARLWPEVAVCFTEKDGRLIQKRLAQVRENQDAYHDRMRQRSASGNAARWNKDKPAIPEVSHKDASGSQQGVLTPILNHRSSSSSSSSSSDLKAADAALAPPRTSAGPPLQGYQRLRVWPWMAHELVGMLGAHAVDFDLDLWLLTLDQSGEVLPAKIWPWLKERLAADAATRGLVPATPAKVSSLDAAVAHFLKDPDR